MRKFLKIIIFLLLGAGWLVALWLGVLSKPIPFHEAIADRIAQRGLESASVGIAVLDDKGRLLAEWNTTQSITPASALKTLTAAAALGSLGPDYRFPTILATAEPPIEGVIDGNLVLRGSGDPFLSREDLERLVTQLSELGIERVTGGIVADPTLFPDRAASGHWNWGDVGNAYGAGVFGINVEGNRYLAVFNPGPDVGAPAEFLGPSLDLPDVEWRNFVTTGPPGSGDGVVIYGGPHMPVVELWGTVPLGEPGFRVGGAIPNPPLLAARYLHLLLEDAGITIDGTTSVSSHRPAEEFELARVESPPLKEIVRSFLASSDNVGAQAVYLAAGGRQGFLGFWRGTGIPIEGLRIEDGSGLARATRIRPLDLALCLHAARVGLEEIDFIEFMPGRGEIRAKGGAMSGVRAQAGYWKNPGAGQPATFVIIANGLDEGADFNGFLSDFHQLLQEIPLLNFPAETPGEIE